MSKYTLFDFQNDAVNQLLNKYNTSLSDNIVLQAPTGSGKTVMLIEFMDKICELYLEEHIAFIWLTPGAGELEEQSWNKTTKAATQVRAQFLQDALTNGFNNKTVTFINWELVRGRKNIATRDGETKNIYTAIEEARSQNIDFVLIIDEEHRDQTAKAQNIISCFSAKKIIRASATPRLKNSSYDIVRVTEDQAIAEHLITRMVVLNQDIEQNPVINDAVEYFLDAADFKRQEIKNAYLKMDIDVNPLVLIQFPDETRTNKIERNTLIDQVENYLIEGLGQKNNQIAKWLSEDHYNIENIEKNNNLVNYLIIKQAVSTGWDAPRAKILVKLRLNTDPTFTVQTIGRIRRMPEQKHYNNEIIDNAFVYSNDDKYVEQILDEKDAYIVETLTRKSNTPKLNLKSIKPVGERNIDALKILKAYHKQFVQSFKLTKSTDQNQETLSKKYNWVFGDKIHRSLLSGEVEHLREITELKGKDIEYPVDTRKHSWYLHDAESMIARYLHVDRDNRKTNAILRNLFSSVEQVEPSVPRLLKLQNREWYAFIINNRHLLRDVAKEMDTGTFSYQLDFLSGINSGELEINEFNLPRTEWYQKDKSITQPILMKKNVYDGYSNAHMVKQSKPEKEFELWMEHTDKVKWVYRSKDHGSEYFSIAYGGHAEGFFPDYIVQDITGKIYIIETKGGQHENIDPYAREKFNALKQYVNGKWGKEIRFAFVRPIWYPSGDLKKLVFNNTEWDENTNDSINWRSLDELFEQD